MEIERIDHAVGVDDVAGSAPEEVRAEHVLLPLDGSTLAAAALPTARALAKRFGADLHTISVADDDRHAGRLRRKVAAALGTDNKQAVHLVVGRDPAESIRERADELGSCLVCLSSRSRGRVAGAVFGSVARAVLLSSIEPIVVVGPQADRPPAMVRSGARRRRPRGWPEPLSIRRLIACVDGSAESEAVLPTASAWASTLDMKLTILTIAEADAEPMFGGNAAKSRFGPRDPATYVAELASTWSVAGPTAVEGRVVYDPLGIASGMRQHLREEPAGLLALTTHARSGMERIRLGAAAADIVRSSTAPALVVPLPA
jgi:nucleotide-binding universal stress UspA family protein